MKIYHGRISVDGLRQVPEADRKLFLALAHLQNEIRFLLRPIQWSSDYSSDLDAVVHGQFSMSFFFTKLLAGKLREGWEVMTSHYFNQKDLVSRFQNKADSEALQSLSNLKKQFSQGNLLHKVRNNFAFHYNPNAIENEIGKSPDALDLYIEAKPDANTLYYFAEILANRAALRILGSAESVEAMDGFIKTILQCALEFNKFNLAFLHFITSEYKDIIWDGEATEVPLTGLKQFSECRMPWFADTTNGIV